MATVGDLRRSSVVMTFGPGAIADFREGAASVSGVIAGLEEWDNGFPPKGLANPQVIHEERLEKLLAVAGFRLPPVRTSDDNDERSLVAVRFPDWLQCPTCNRIGPSERWQGDPGMAARFCGPCSAKAEGGHRKYVIPLRFVMACPKGHLSDFPWHEWVHHKSDCARAEMLTLTSEAAGLAGLMVRCPKCRQERSLDGIFQEATWEGWHCRGQRPWLAAPSEECDKAPRALQRGASNIYFPVIESALSIPPWAEGLQLALGDLWHTLMSVEGIPDRVKEITKLAAIAQFQPRFEHVGLPPERLAARIEDLKRQLETVGWDSIRRDEHEQFSTAATAERFADFEVRSVAVPALIAPYVSQLVRAVRLREVRVLRGFTRIQPPAGDANSEVSPIAVSRPTWYPGIEVRGEGIFFSLESARVAEWEMRPDVAGRAAWVHARWEEEWAARHHDKPIPRKITARFLLVHALSHTLMRQVTLECGYSTASLRERLYVGDEPNAMAGVLIYTAAPDADGTLGGLERQGRPERFEPTFVAALKASEWCSSDPLCIHGRADEQLTLSNAACHACLFAPETSCEEYNRFLDRAMLVGTPDKPEVGFFSQLLRP